VDLLPARDLFGRGSKRRMSDVLVVALSVVTLVAVAVAVVAHVRLHLLPTGRRPLRDAVSDYGAGPYRAWYRTTVIGLAIASASLTVAFARAGGPGAGPLIALGTFGVSRLAIVWFPVDLPGEPATSTGRVHNVLAVVAFASIAVAASSIPDGLTSQAWSGKSGGLNAVGAVVMWVAVATAVFFVVPPLRRWFGLVERALYWATFAWLALAAADLIAIYS
jgi:Protein of unknown function (DUF998)